MNLIKKLRGGNGTGTLAEADRGLSLFRREIDRAFERTRRAFERSPWRPFDELEKSSWPAMDVSEDEQSFSVSVDVPGLGPKDMEVEVSGNLLTVKARASRSTRSASAASSATSGSPAASPGQSPSQARWTRPRWTHGTTRAC
jgi:hypothetical protein